MMTFKDYLIEMQMDKDMTPQEIQRAHQMMKNNPKMAARQNAIKQKAEADVARQDDTIDPQKKRIEQQEADIARKKAALAQRTKQEQTQ